MSAPATSSGPPPSDKTVKERPRPPGLLAPPSTIISPPSPVEQTTGRFHDPFPPTSSSSASSSHPPSHPSSPPPEPSSPTLTERPRAPSDSLGPIPLAATFMSASPGPASPHKRDSLVPPESPDPSSSRPLGERSPSPSSPGFHPIRPGHRRESSTHRVRETIDAHQSSTEKGERLINQYRIGQSLGQGSFAKVELGIDVSTGKEYAVKEFSKSRLHYQALQEKQRQMSRGRYRRAQENKSPVMGPDGAKRKAADAGREANKSATTSTLSEDDPLHLIRREIAVMKKLDHPNLVQLYEVISVPNADALFLVLEYLPGGVLMHVELGAKQPHEPPFSMDQSREYFRQLCLGLEYLHANEVVHRDVKPDNILLSADRSTVKLCDFGVSEMFMAQGDDRIKKSGGSPAFLSPESFTSHIHEIHGKAVDIWALGVTLYCMLSGDLPFNVENPMELFDLVQKQSPEIPKDWDPSLRELMEKMFCKIPEQRISMSEIKENGWVTAHEPMISTEDNLYHVGKHVEEPSQEELNSAIGSLRGVFTVIRAIQKMRRLQLHRRSLSGVTPSSPGSTTAVSSMDSYTSGGPGTDISSISDLDEQRFRDLMGGPVASPKRFDTPLAEEKEDNGNNSESSAPAETKRGGEDTTRAAKKQEVPESPTKTGREKLESLRIDTRSAHREESDKTVRGKAERGGDTDVVMVDSPAEEVQSPTQMVDSPVDELNSPEQMVESPVDEG